MKINETDYEILKAVYRLFSKGGNNVKISRKDIQNASGVSYSNFSYKLKNYYLKG